MNDFPESVVVVHAHPDDTEAFCAGTLALLSRAGFSVTIVTMTGGGLGGVGLNEEQTVALRKKEAREAAAKIGAEYVCMDLRDGYVYDTEESRIRLTSLFRRCNAGIVLTHLPNDYHMDHRATAAMAEAAALVSVLPNVPCRETPLSVTPLLYHTAPLGFSDPLGYPISPPHFFLDVGSVMDIRRSMLACHESQIDLMKRMHRMDNFFEAMEAYNRELGAMVGCDFAEVFWQHKGGGFQKNPVIQETLKDYLLSVPEDLLRTTQGGRHEQ